MSALTRCVLVAAARSVGMRYSFAKGVRVLILICAYGGISRRATVELADLYVVCVTPMSFIKGLRKSLSYTLT